MNITKLTLFALLFMGHCSCLLAQTFKITGTTTGVDDGTWLYLRTASPEKLLDSTKVANGKFSFIGKTDEKINQMAIYTAKYKNYVFFWAEQNTHLQLKNGEFKKAIITGSKTQDEVSLRSKLGEPNSKAQDSLNQILAKTKDETLKKGIRERLIALRAEDQQADKGYVSTHPNSLVAVYILSVYSSTWGKTTTASLYEKLSAEMKKTSYGKNIQNFLSLNKEVKIGGQFVDFEQTNVAGKKIKLSDIKGKYILLEFWGSWCGPCREENPNLVKTYNLYKDKGFAILGVAADENKNQWLKAIKDDGLPWENVSDLKGDKNEAALIYGISGYPTNYLINEKGVIVAKNLRGDALEKKLEELLN